MDSVVTDPPYGLSFMGKSWDYDVPKVEVWREVLRVLKPGGHLLSFFGTRTYHRGVVAIEDAGFEIRDQIGWIYSSGFPKSLNISKAINKLDGVDFEEVPASGVGFMNPDGDGGYNVTKNQLIQKGESSERAKQWEGWGTALKPAHEDLVVARKPFVNIGEYDILVRKITISLCQLPSLALLVKSSSPSSQNESGEELSIAQWIADERTSTSDALFVLMATLQSELAKAKNTNLSIATSWLAILDDLLKRGSTSTTEMKLSLTTDLKTLSYLLSEITQNTTTEEETKASGVDTSVEIVETIFGAIRMKLAVIQHVSAKESAIDKAGEKGLQPNYENIVVARKPIDGTVANNVLRWNVGGLNIDACRITPQDTNKKDTGCSHGMREINDATSLSIEQCGNKHTWQSQQDTLSTTSTKISPTIGSKISDSNAAISTQGTIDENTHQENRNLRQDEYNSESVINEESKTQNDTNSGEERNTLGRWPANLLHDGSPEVLSLFPETAKAKASKRGADRNGNVYGTYGLQDTVRGHDDNGGSAARFFKQCEYSEQDYADRLVYCAKASKRDRNEGCEGLEEKVSGSMDGNSGKSGTRTAGDGTTQIKTPLRQNHHPTVKPTDLMRYLCRLVTPKGGTVLDPFMGSGSTGKAATLEWLNFIGIEREAEYVEIAQKRIDSVTA